MTGIFYRSHSTGQNTGHSCLLQINKPDQKCLLALILVQNGCFWLRWNYLVYLTINKTVTCNHDLRNVICKRNHSNYRKKLWKPMQILLGRSIPYYSITVHAFTTRTYSFRIGVFAIWLNRKYYFTGAFIFILSSDTNQLTYSIYTNVLYKINLLSHLYVVCKKIKKIIIITGRSSHLHV